MFKESGTGNKYHSRTLCQKSVLYLCLKRIFPIYMPRNSWRDVYDFKDGHQVKWIRAGTGFFSEMIALINGAKKNIYLQYYIIVPDETGRPVLNALKNAAARGVEDSPEQAATTVTATARPSAVDSRPRDVIRNEVSMPPNV